ncbi:YiaA/YiaB family inner membrane protein, partial [Klebsiella pneumoniae]
GMMAAGSLVYLLGIWRTCPLFSGKGYFLGVLVMGMFAVLAHQRARRWQGQDDGFIALCRLVLLLSAGLLLVGAWHVPADW